jgi:SpoVK/Ycf46/Vps4 family AAA+-type ATPase
VRGILMYGPPGCSKTLLARAFAAESRFNFINVKAQELISKYVGDTEHNIRELFRRARAAAPAAIFFDEFDSMAKRDTGHDSLNPVTALLTEMDGFEISTGVTVLAATNQPWLIDEALLRPGRFDKLCYVGPPDIEARKQILYIGTRRKPVAEGVDFQELARRTDGYSGAEVAEVCKIAARICWEQSDLQDSSKEVARIRQEHFIKAIDDIAPGITENMLQAFEQWRISRSAKRNRKT